jgi:hypothetical protein
MQRLKRINIFSKAITGMMLEKIKNKCELNPGHLHHRLPTELLLMTLRNVL